MTGKNLLAATKGIVFDLDDTLYSQRSFKLSGFRAVSEWLAATFRLDANCCYQGLEQVMSETSPSYPHIFDLFIERNKLPPDCLDIMVRIFVEHWPHISCYPSARLLLGKLRRIYHVGILTDGRLTVQQRKVQALDIESDVDMVLYSDSMGLEKPANELYRWYEKRFPWKESILSISVITHIKILSGRNSGVGELFEFKLGVCRSRCRRSFLCGRRSGKFD